MSGILIGFVVVVVLAILIYCFAPSSRNRRGPPIPRPDDTPLAAGRVAEETHHAARMGAVQGKGLVDGVGPFTGTLPRGKRKRDSR